MHQIKSAETWLILGASSGLGAAFANLVAKSEFAPARFILSARNSTNLEKVKKGCQQSREDLQVDIVTVDVSKIESLDEYLRAIKEWQIDRAFYFIGGGPYGAYASKEFKDHLWGWNVSFVAFAKLLHFFMQSKAETKQITVVGSSVAENSTDKNAASYSASKHALYGLIRTLASENQGRLDLRLFSPGFMDTKLLPPNAKPRQTQEGVWPVEDVAEILLRWICAPSSQWHQVMTSQPQTSKLI